MKKNIHTPLSDKYLETLDNIREAETDPFFYTRLTARMVNNIPEHGFPLKPAWLVGMLIIFIFINSFFLVTQVRNSKETSVEATPLQNFASEYNLSVSTPF